jgi:hypothetical protein
MTASFKAATQKQKFEGLVFDGSIVQASKIPVAYILLRFVVGTLKEMSLR